MLGVHFGSGSVDQPAPLPRPCGRPGGPEACGPQACARSASFPDSGLLGLGPADSGGARPGPPRRKRPTLLGEHLGTSLSVLRPRRPGHERRRPTMLGAHLGTPIPDGGCFGDLLPRPSPAGQDANGRRPTLLGERFGKGGPVTQGTHTRGATPGPATPASSPPRGRWPATRPRRGPGQDWRPARHGERIGGGGKRQATRAGGEPARGSLRGRAQMGVARARARLGGPSRTSASVLRPCRPGSVMKEADPARRTLREGPAGGQAKDEGRPTRRVNRNGGNRQATRAKASQPDGTR